MDLYNLILTAKIQKGEGGGGDVTVNPLSVSSNGVYTASSGYAYSPVTVSVPGIVPSGTSAITSNGIYDVSNFASASVNVPIPSGYIQPTGTSSITANGIYNISSFASVDVNVSGGGGITAEQIIERTISGVISGNTSAGLYNGVFQSCKNITEAYFPNASFIGSYAFSGCDSLSIIDFSNATSIYSSAFQGCYRLTSAIFPKVVMVGGSAFYQDSALTAVSFPIVTRVGSCAFEECRNLLDANFPQLESIYSMVFRFCYSLSTASFPKVSRIESYAFTSCSKLMSLYLLSTSVVSLYSTTAFSSTPMHFSSYTGSFGSIYVPASLVADYKVASNWKTFSNRITSYVE